MTLMCIFGIVYAFYVFTYMTVALIKEAISPMFYIILGMIFSFFVTTDIYVLVSILLHHRV